jgi:hypothetical protein
MRFLVSVQSPKIPGLQAAGDWLVDAEDRELALAVVQERAVSQWWPRGSTWTVNAHSEDRDLPNRAR